jgi:hypothetical protein
MKDYGIPNRIQPVTFVTFNIYLLIYLNPSAWKSPGSRHLALSEFLNTLLKIMYNTKNPQGFKIYFAASAA